MRLIKAPLKSLFLRQHFKTYWLFSIIAISLLAGFIGHAVAGSEITHTQALSFSDAEGRLAQAHKLQAQQADVEAWQAQQAATKSLNTPQLSITVAGIAYAKKFSFELPVINQPFDFKYDKTGIRSQVQLLWPLYTGGRTQAAQQQSKARVTEAQAEQQVLQLELTRHLLELYFGSQLTRQVVEVRAQALQALEQHLHKATRYEQEGLINQLNKMQAEVAYAQTRRELLKAESQHQDTQAALANLLQLPEPACLSTPLPIPKPLPHSAAWFVQQGQQQNPVFAQLLAKNQQLSQQLKMEQGKRLPEIFLVGEYDLNRSATPLVEPDWSVGLGIRYHFTTPINRSSAVRVVRHRQQQLELLTAQAKADIQLAIEHSFRAVQTALSQFELLQADLDLAQTHATLQQRAFEEGTSTSLDVTDARLKQAAAEVENLQAAYEYLTALAQLSQYSGQLNLVAHLLPELLQSQTCTAQAMTSLKGN